MWASICFIMSTPTPTTISSDVPPIQIPVIPLAPMISYGRTAITVRNSAPMSNTRLSTRSI